MTIRNRLAKWLDPEMAKHAEQRDWLLTEISYNARWLGEFPFMSRTLDRIVAMMVDWYRPLGQEAKCKERQSISDYREELRRERDKQKEPSAPDDVRGIRRDGW